MKIVRTDNYDRDHINDLLVAENVHEIYGKKIVEQLNSPANWLSEHFFILVPDEYVLKKFEP